MDAASMRWLLLTVTLTRAGPPPGDSASLRLQAWGAAVRWRRGRARWRSTGPSAGRCFPPALLAFAAIGGGVADRGGRPAQGGRR